jgi:nucleoside phosphorylase
MLKDADARFDCFAILDALYSRDKSNSGPEVRANQWLLLWRDLQSRSAMQSDRAELLQLGLASELPIDFRPVSWKDKNALSAFRADPRIKADVIIISVIEAEFNAVLAAFGLRQTEAEIIWIFGHPFVQTTLSSPGGPLSVWITLIGMPRNVPCTHFCRDVFERFSVRLGCILVGIAAGHREKFQLGDVVGGQSVWDIEGERVETKEGKPRLVPYPMKPTMEEALRGFSPRRWKWLADRASTVALLEVDGEKMPENWEEKVPAYRPGVIVAGEKLRRDDPLPRLARRFGDEIVALEMEGSGFAAACIRKDIPWFVFRGISDFGTKRKRDEWHTMAAAHAALAAKSFIQYRLYGTAEAASDIPA